MSQHGVGEKLLGDLQKKLVNRYLALVEETDDPRILNGIAKLLADNKVTFKPEDQDALTELERQLSGRTRRFADLKEEAAKSARDSIH